jgi:hypothetical protein
VLVSTANSYLLYLLLRSAVSVLALQRGGREATDKQD